MRTIIQATLLFLMSGQVHAEVYRKIDPNTGHITLTNIPPRSGTEAEAPEKKTALPPKAMPAPSTKSPGDFPKVSPVLQKERDTDRKKILEDELKAEQLALKEANEKKAAAEIIARHKINILALEREITNVK
jgi:hypothetical protein